jgi:hypothetical protein
MLDLCQLSHHSSQAARSPTIVLHVLEANIHFDDTEGLVDNDVVGSLELFSRMRIVTLREMCRLSADMFRACQD